jgi:hypothetical protein
MKQLWDEVYGHEMWKKGKNDYLRNKLMGFIIF